jgi:hypothetical protein
MLALAGDGDMDDRALTCVFTRVDGQHSPQLRGASVAQDRVGPAGQHSRRPSAPIAEPGVSNRIDTAMNAVEASKLEAITYRA